MKRSENIETIFSSSVKDPLLDFFDFGIVFISPEGKIVACNKHFEEITGSSLEEFEGTTGEHLFLEQLDVLKLCKRLNDRKTGLSRRYQLQIKRKDDSKIWISVSAKPKFNELDEFIGTISVVEDITDQIQVDHVQEIIDELPKNDQKQDTNITMRLTGRINNLILNLKDGVVFVDKNGIISDVNNAICEMLGYSEQELVGSKALDTFYPSQKNRDFNEIFRKDGTPLEDRYTIQVEQKNGILLWVTLSLTPEYDENDSLLGVVAILTDISNEQAEKGRKERLYRLHESFITLNKAISRGYNLEQIHQTVMGILHSTYKINVSRIYKVNYTEDDQQNLSLAAERLMSKSLTKLSSLFPNGIRDVTPQPSQGSPYLHAIEDQTPQFINGKQTIYSTFSSLIQDPSIEKYKQIMTFMKIDFYALFPIIHFNETHYLIECVSENLLDEGDMDDLSAFMQQVNALIDKKMGDIDLQKNERKWRGLIENSSEITCIINRSGKIIFISPSVERMLGYSHGTILDDNIFSYIHPEDRGVAEERFDRRLSEGGEGYYQILRIRHATDNYRFFRVFTSNHMDKEEIEGLIVNAQDITDMFKTENEKYLSIIETEENERKRISRDLHDGVGQYLAATNMYMNLLETTISDKLDEPMIDLFNKTAEMLRKATSEIRTVSHNIMSPSLKDFGFLECVKGLVEGLSQGSVPVRFTFSEDVGILNIPEWVGLTLFRAIQQILSNAITHGEPKNVNVVLHKNQKIFTIEIKDDGIGFDPSRINDRDGIGIMSIRHRIQSVGGRTIITSEPGKGTNFKILISTSTLK